MPQGSKMIYLKYAERKTPSTRNYISGKKKVNNRRKIIAICNKQNKGRILKKYTWIPKEQKIKLEKGNIFKNYVDKLLKVKY